MKGISRFLMLLLFIIALFAGLVFSGHNQTPVGLWLGTEFGARPLSLWVIAAFISGGLLGLILGLGLWRSRASRKTIKQLRQKLLFTENELKKEKQHGSVSKTELKGL
jgi:uncharacterized integral membrane protein